MMFSLKDSMDARERRPHEGRSVLGTTSRMANLRMSSEAEIMTRSFKDIQCAISMDHSGVVRNVSQREEWLWPMDYVSNAGGEDV